MMKQYLHGLCTFPNMVINTLQSENKKEICDQEVKENKIMMIGCVSDHAMGCWEDGADHDYWFQCWGLFTWSVHFSKYSN